MIRVYVADPHPIIHKGIKAIFRNSSEVTIVGKGYHFRDMYDFLNTKKVDLVIFELELPGLRNIHALRKLKDKHPKVRFLIFSTLKAEHYAINSLKFGASGFLSKTSPFKRLKDAVIQLGSEGTVINYATESMMFTGSEINPETLFEELSDREAQVLRLLIHGKKNIEIAATLHLSEKTVSTYRTRLMKKLDVNNLVEMISKLQHLNLDMY